MDPKEHLALAKAIPGEDKRGGKSQRRIYLFFHSSPDGFKNIWLLLF